MESPHKCSRLKWSWQLIEKIMSWPVAKVKKKKICFIVCKLFGSFLRSCTAEPLLNSFSYLDDFVLSWNGICEGITENWYCPDLVKDALSKKFIRG